MSPRRIPCAVSGLKPGAVFELGVGCDPNCKPPTWLPGAPVHSKKFPTSLPV